MKDDDYYDKGKRNIAVERIWDNMSGKEFFPLPTCGQIIEKMNGLCTYFNTQPWTTKIPGRDKAKPRSKMRRLNF